MAEKILVVDNDQPSLAFFRAALGMAGFDALTTADPTAVVTLRDQTPGYIALNVLDIMMPELSGLELGRQICAREPSARLLFVSGSPACAWSNKECELLQSLAPPSFCFLPKPFTLNSFLECVCCRLQGLYRLPSCPKHGLPPLREGD